MTDRLSQVKKFYRRYHCLPSYSTMLSLFGLASKKSIYDIVHKWIEEGILQKINRKLAPTAKFFSLPIYGIVKAGFPILADEERKYFTLDEYLIANPETSFLLKVSGDSMINVGIFDGDLVIVEKRRPLPGDIVLAEIDREWTLKFLKKDRRQNRVYLEAANPDYPPFYPKQELVIHGVIRGVIRKFAN